MENKVLIQRKKVEISRNSIGILVKSIEEEIDINNIEGGLDFFSGQAQNR